MRRIFAWAIKSSLNYNPNKVNFFVSFESIVALYEYLKVLFYILSFFCVVKPHTDFVFHTEFIKSIYLHFTCIYRSRISYSVIKFLFNISQKFSPNLDDHLCLIRLAGYVSFCLALLPFRETSRNVRILHSKSDFRVG